MVHVLGRSTAGLRVHLNLKTIHKNTSAVQSMRCCAPYAADRNGRPDRRSRCWRRRSGSRRGCQVVGSLAGCADWVEVATGSRPQAEAESSRKGAYGAGAAAGRKRSNRERGGDGGVSKRGVLTEYRCTTPRGKLAEWMQPRRFARAHDRVPPTGAPKRRIKEGFIIGRTRTTESAVAPTADMGYVAWHRDDLRRHVTRRQRDSRRSGVKPPSPPG